MKTLKEELIKEGYIITDTYSDGKIEEARKELPNGRFETIIFYDNSNNTMSRKEQYNEKGEREGIAESWYNNGQQEYRYYLLSDKLYGLFESWGKNGQLTSMKYYKNDAEIGSIYFKIENGQLKFDEIVFNGDSDDVFKKSFEQSAEDKLIKYNIELIKKKISAEKKKLEGLNKGLQALELARAAEGTNLKREILYWNI